MLKVSVVAIAPDVDVLIGAHVRPASVLISSFIEPTPLASVADDDTLTENEFAGTFIAVLLTSVITGAVTVGACASMPSPLSVNACAGLLFALSWNTSLPTRVPGAVGLNCTVMLQVAFNATVVFAHEFAVTVKSAGP